MTGQLTNVIEERVRAFWEQAFNGRDLDLIDAITAPEMGLLRQFGARATTPGDGGHVSPVRTAR